MREVPCTDEGRNYGMGHKEIETETNCEDQNKPKEVEQITNCSPVSAVDVFWVHFLFFTQEPPPHPPRVIYLMPYNLPTHVVQKEFAINFV